MSDDGGKNWSEEDKWLRERLLLAVERFAGGSAEKFAQELLGLKNGGPVREVKNFRKKVRRQILVPAKRVEALRGWFDDELRMPQPAKTELQAPFDGASGGESADALRLAVAAIANAMGQASDGRRQAAAAVLPRIATHPNDYRETTSTILAVVGDVQVQPIHSGIIGELPPELQGFLERWAKLLLKIRDERQLRLALPLVGEALQDAIGAKLTEQRDEAPSTNAPAHQPPSRRRAHKP